MTCRAVAPRRRRGARTCFAIAGLVVLAASGCGAKGPPLPPLRPVPAAPSGVAASRVGDQVTLRFVVPEANADPASPLSISGIEIYARTLPMGSESPTAEQLIRKEYLVATIPVRPPPPVPEPGAPTPPEAPVTPAPDDKRPRPGETIVWTETIPAATLRPLELTRAQQARMALRRTIWLPIKPTGLLGPWFHMPLPTRYYAAVGVSERQRAGSPSTFAAVSFGPAPDAPADLKIDSNESQLIVSWTTTVPGAPVMVIETNKAGVEQAAPVQELPITTGSWSTPVAFGVERCFVVRGVVRRGAVSTGSTAAGPVCFTPKDIYGPPAPTELQYVLGPNEVTLVWNPVTAPDLAGYIVLRVTGNSETVEELTPKPITQLQFPDATARAGQRYVYYVVAVDTAGNRGLRSNAVTVDRSPSTGK